MGVDTCTPAAAGRRYTWHTCTRYTCERSRSCRGYAAGDRCLGKKGGVCQCTTCNNSLPNVKYPNNQNLIFWFRLTSPPVQPNLQMFGVDLKIGTKYQEFGSDSLCLITLYNPFVQFYWSTETASHPKAHRCGICLEITTVSRHLSRSYCESHRCLFGQ